MTYQIVVAVLLFIFLVNLILNLRSLRVPSNEGRIPDPAPLVSVLIPARDEAANIRTCLESLQKQDYANFEVLVLDDNSSDGTGAIAGAIAANDDRIRLFVGDPLPRDWAGKPFACFQLAKRAKGSWLLFVDADTIHAPHMIRSVLALSLEMKASLLSGFPRQLASSLPQKAAIPVLYFVIVSWLPLWLLQRSKNARPSLAIGQFLLFPRDEYWKIGGHEAVKSRILEDVWLGIETVRGGGRHVAVNLSSVVSCNMYRTVGTMWEGFIKWVYSVAVMSWAAVLVMLLAAYIFFLAPFYWGWRALFWSPGHPDWVPIVLFQIAIILVMRWLVDSHFKEPLVSTLLHPIGFSFLFLAGLYGGARRAVGAGVSWKKRVYEKESGVH